MDEIKYKQFIIVPKKPRMSPGKIASQVAHATFMALENQNEYFSKYPNKEDTYKLITDWKKEGMCVIVLQCKNTEQLMSADKYLEQWKIPHHLYIDEGHTEVDPLTPTALATGVLTEEQFWMLSQFKLYK